MESSRDSLRYIVRLCGGRGEREEGEKEREAGEKLTFRADPDSHFNKRSPTSL